LRRDDIFEVKATDLGGRIGSVTTKTATFETPALLPVIHPVRQLVPCAEIRAMGYEAVMTNAYTTYRQLRERASEGIHEIIGFEGSVMTDSGGYQVLEYGSVDIQVEEMARFEEILGSDIAIILDKPTGLDVSRKFAAYTVKETIAAAERTAKVIENDKVIWTLPIQGGKYLDLVTKSSKGSSLLGYDCHALGSPVEVMEEYDFSLLVRMIIASKKHLPINKPFHLFGAGHPLILPLSVALGCDMFDSASYILYARQDRYISLQGTVRLDDLEYLGCPCKVCSTTSARELRSLVRNERTISLARHNLAVLRQIIEETKQAIWEGRLWEYVQASCRDHPKSLEAFMVAVAGSTKDRTIFEEGTPALKDRGIFNSEKIDLQRPELVGYRARVKNLDFSRFGSLVILPETRTKPFLKSEIFEELTKLLQSNDGHEDNAAKALVTFLCPNVGLVPAEISDIFPLSQYTNSYQEYPANDPIMNRKDWSKITLLLKDDQPELESRWLRKELAEYLRFENDKKIDLTKSQIRSPGRRGTLVTIAHSYRELKNSLR
jgi:7-cyano-7-deazaguanine tRNA-ribosyltransferase